MSQEETVSHFAKKYFAEIDEIAESDNYFVPVLRDVALKIDFRTARVLDVGCGTGIFLKPIINAGCDECFGVDGPSEYAPRAVARGYREVQFVADLNNCPLPYLSESFDLVVCKDVFEHLLNPVFCLHEIRRVLKKDGLFLFHVPNHFPLYGRVKFLFSNEIDTFSFFGKESRWTFPNIRFYEHFDSLRILAENNFELVSDLSHHFQAIPLLSRIKCFQRFGKFLVNCYPNEFAAGFTYLVKRK